MTVLTTPEEDPLLVLLGREGEREGERVTFMNVLVQFASLSRDTNICISLAQIRLTKLPRCVSQVAPVCAL